MEQKQELREIPPLRQVFVNRVDPVYTTARALVEEQQTRRCKFMVWACCTMIAPILLLTLLICGDKCIYVSRTFHYGFIFVMLCLYAGTICSINILVRENVFNPEA
jgi:hypothetical protein